MTSPKAEQLARTMGESLRCIDDMLELNSEALLPYAAALMQAREALDDGHIVDGQSQCPLCIAKAAIDALLPEEKHRKIAGINFGPGGQ